MTHVVIENCIKCKFTDCVTVCPVNCFKEGNNFLVIDPDECIDCSICIPECPVESIKYDQNLNENQKIFLKINKELSKYWNTISDFKKNKNNKKWLKIKNKLHLIKL